MHPTETLSCYRPQRSCEVMFLHLFVILFKGEGVVPASVHAGIHPPLGADLPEADPPPRAHTPLLRADIPRADPPGSKAPPPEADTPTPGTDTPLPSRRILLQTVRILCVQDEDWDYYSRLLPLHSYLREFDAQCAPSAALGQHRLCKKFKILQTTFMIST